MVVAYTDTNTKKTQFYFLHLTSGCSLLSYADSVGTSIAAATP